MEQMVQTVSEVAPNRSDCVEVWYDGCCEPVNPGGHAACGVLIKRDGQVLWQESRYIGYGPAMSNNVKELARQFSDITFVWIPREENAEADALSKMVLKEKEVRFRIQREV